MCAEERNLREENRKLQETLQLEKERSEQLCRALSESESSLDGSLIDWDRYSSASGYDYLRDTYRTKENTNASINRDISRPNLSSPHIITSNSNEANNNPNSSLPKIHASSITDESQSVISESASELDKAFSNIRINNQPNPDVSIVLFIQSSNLECKQFRRFHLNHKFRFRRIFHCTKILFYLPNSFSQHCHIHYQFLH